MIFVKTRNKLVFVFFLNLMLLGKLSFADEVSESSWLDDMEIKLSAKGSIDYWAGDSDDFESNWKTKDVNIKLEAQFNDAVKAVLVAELNRNLVIDGENVSSKFSWETFLEEAYIQIDYDKINNTPIALVFGRIDSTYGTTFRGMAITHRDLIYADTYYKYVWGVAVVLKKELLKDILDKVEISVFENSENDFDFGGGAGAAIRISKTLTKALKMKASVLASKIEKKDDYDKKAMVTFIYGSTSGRWKAYINGLVLDGKYDDSRLGASAGFMFDLWKGEVAMEISVLQSIAKEIGLAYHIPVGEFIKIAPEFRYRFDIENKETDEEFSIGVRTTLDFGTITLKEKN
jgi:hypothetical protein